MTNDKIYVVFDGSSPDDDWIDSIWDNKEWAKARLRYIRIHNTNPEPEGRMEVFTTNKPEGEIEAEAIHQHDNKI
jgi:hypothetical protein